MNAIKLSYLNVRINLLRLIITLAVALPVGVSAQHMDHSGMEMPAEQQATDPHAGHTMPTSDDLPREPIPPITPADRAAAFPDVNGHTVHDDSIHHYALFNRLEAWNADPGSGFAWEGQGWLGTDLNRMWVRSEGERVDGVTEAANLEVLYGRATARWWDVVAGVRQDLQPGGSQTSAALGVIGVAPYEFEVAATAYINESGETAARLETEYEILLANRLILQPVVEVSLFGQDDERRGIGSGLSSIEAGLRLRYEIRREFAPYIGVSWEKSFGNTADFARARGEAVDDTQVVVGLRTWF